MAGVLAIGALGMPALATAHHWHGGWGVAIGPGWWGPPAYVGPEPVAACRDVWVDGRWVNMARTDPSGLTTYGQEWIPGHWERACP